MPDLTRQHFWRCDAELTRTFASTSRTAVIYTASARGNEVHCSCPGFANHGHCWHSKEVWEAHCQWNEHWNSMGLTIKTDVEGAFTCPHCGGPVASFSDAV